MIDVAGFLDQVRSANKRKRGYHRLGKPASARRLAQWHKEHAQWQLPADYTAFLQAADGIELKAGAEGGTEFTFLPLAKLQGVARQIWGSDTARDGEYAPTWVCIATDPDGMRFLGVDTGTGRYFMIDHEQTALIAQDMATLEDLLTWVSEHYLEGDEELPPVKADAATEAESKPVALVELPRFDNHQSPVMRLAIAPAGDVAASADQAKLVKIWDLATRQLRREISMLALQSHQTCGLAASSLALAPEGQNLAVAMQAGLLWMIDLQTGQERWRTHLQTDNGWALMALAFSPDGRLLAGADSRCVIRVWETATGHELAPFVGHAAEAPNREPNVVYDLSFSPDGRRLASSDAYKTLALWDVGTRQNLGRFAPQRWPACCLAFSPDGQELACGYLGNKAINFWRCEGGALRLSVPVRGGSGTLSAAYSSDGTKLISGGRDARVRLWDVASGREIAQSKVWHSATHEGNFRGVGFVEGGRKILGASAIGRLVLFEVPQ